MQAQRCLSPLLGSWVPAWEHGRSAQGGEGARSGSADPCLCGEEAGGGRQPGFPSGAEVGTFHFHPALAVYDREQAAAAGKEAPRERGAAQHTRHSTSRLPGQGTERLTMAPGALKKTRGSVKVALADLCAILLCCWPMLACCRRGRYKSVVCSLTWPCRLQLVENV